MYDDFFFPYEKAKLWTGNMFLLSLSNFLLYASLYMMLPVLPLWMVRHWYCSYAVDDLLAGWYCVRAGYGTTYAMQGTISVSGGVVSLVDSFLAGWGDSATSLTDGTFDIATGTMTYNLEYTDTPMNFYVTMYKK